MFRQLFGIESFESFGGAASAPFSLCIILTWAHLLKTLWNVLSFFAATFSCIFLGLASFARVTNENGSIGLRRKEGKP